VIHSFWRKSFDNSPTHSHSKAASSAVQSSEVGSTARTLQSEPYVNGRLAILVLVQCSRQNTFLQIRPLQ
jgi:Lon protease-like protein